MTAARTTTTPEPTASRRVQRLFALTSRAALVALLLGCGGSTPAATPPVTSTPSSQVAPASTTAEDAGGYAGHGAESLSPEVLARFAPTPIPDVVSRRIQAMLDVRAPVASRVAPRGDALYLTWNVTGTTQVWRLDGPRRFPVQLTGGEDATRVVDVTADGKWLVVSRDRKGEENPGLYLLAPSGGPLRKVQHLPKVQTQHQFSTPDGKHIYFRSNDAKVDAYAIYRFTIATGQRELVFGEDGLWSVADHVGGKLLLRKATGALTSEIWEYDEDTKKLTAAFGQGELEEYEVSYGATAQEIVVLTSKFGDFRRLYRLKPSGRTGKALASGDTTPLTADAKHDVAWFQVDPARARLYYTTNEAGVFRPHALDARSFTNLSFDAKELGGAAHVSFGAASHDGRWMPVNVSPSTAPTTAHVYDWQSRRLIEWAVPSSPEVDLSAFSPASLEHYPARDGTKIPMFVRRSAACRSPAALCPVLVQFHGGPEGQALPLFNPYAQVFVDAGFIWVEPNVRGSDGYGRSWLHADDGPKRLDVISDIEDAARFIRENWGHDGKAPKVGILGGSYGGYSTLVGMTRFAGAYDAGVANVGMSNLLTFLLNTAPYRRALRISEYGDPEKDRAALVELSPITHIDKLSAPLLLIQGATDPRVPAGEAVQIHDALAKRGVATKLAIFPDEGHGAQKRENRVLQLGMTLDFFERHLKPTPSTR